MAKGPESLTGFIATIRKPNPDEAARIIVAQSKDPDRIVTCCFDSAKENPRFTTRSPHRDRAGGIKTGIVNLLKEMQDADFVQVVDISDR